MHSTGTHEKFRRGLAQFNAGKFFAAHETWEEIWLASVEPEKTLLQGIIQVAAAFHHYRRDNPRGTRSLLGAGLRKLEHCPSVHWDCEIEELRVTLREWVEALRAEGTQVSLRPPQIRRRDPQDAAGKS